MVKRFFKLTYVFALIAIGLSFPAYLLTNVQFDEVIKTTYRAKCLSNNQYIVLQGATSKNDIDEFDEFILNMPSTPEWDIRRDLNFNCKYYDEIQPHIVAYINSKNRSEQIEENLSFNKFKDGVIRGVSIYPELYKLEVVREDWQLNEIYSPILVWFIGAIAVFILLQIARMSYVYIVFGEVVWHPFKSNKK